MRGKAKADSWPEITFEAFSKNVETLRGLMVHTRAVITQLGKAGNMDIMSASAAADSESWVKDVFKQIVMDAFHNVKIGPVHDGKIDYEFLIDQNGFLGWMLVTSPTFMEKYGFSNDWLRFSKEDLRELAVKGAMGKRTAKDDVDKGEK